MFGKNNDDQQDDLNIPTEQVDQLAAAPSETPADETVSIPPVPDSVTSEPSVPVGDVIAPAAEDWQHPGAPITDTATDTPEAEPAAAPPINDVISPYSDQATAPVTPPAPQPASSLPPISIPSLTSSTPTATDTPEDTPTSVASSNVDVNEDLVDIKQKALSELSPLIDELDQPAEDKFRTVMMMIQASDDQSLVPKAYEVAHSIEDEKARAQALLDIVNEINYFTQHPQS